MPQLVLLALAAVAVLMFKHAVADFYLQTPKPHRARCQLSTEKPSFDVFGSWENWDSVKKTVPSATP